MIPTPLRPPSPGVAASLLVVTAAAVVAASPVTIPLTDGAERLWPLASLAVVPAAIELDRVGTRWLEVSAGSIRVRRCVGVGRVLAVLALGWCLGAVVARWLGGSAGVSPAGGHGGPMIRNALAVLGATLGLRATRWADVAWVPITLAVLSSWLLGSGRVPDHPAAWALPLQPWSSAGATASLIAGGLVGIGVFVFRPGVR